MVLTVAVVGLNSCNFLILGLPFMKSEPHQFMCRNESGQGFHHCTKHFICATGLSKDDYYGD